MASPHQIHDSAAAFRSALLNEIEKGANFRNQPIGCNSTPGLRSRTRSRSSLTCMPWESPIFTPRRFCKPAPAARMATTSPTINSLNPEIGTAADYQALCDVLQQHGMGQILDIVPNHMGVTGNANDWWRDVLENGPSSPYDDYFDIAWYASPRPEMHEKLLLPTLGKSYGEALESGEIRLEYAPEHLPLYYFDHCFPLAPHSYAMILERRPDELAALYERDGEALAEYDSIVTAIKYLPSRSETDPVRETERQREKEVIKRRLAALTEAEPEIAEFIERKVKLFNGTPGRRAEL